MNIYNTDKIKIIDNGFGMNKDDINEKLLNVGYKKRDNNFTETLYFKQ